MTKDVLVRVKGTQFMDDENDVIEMITAGTFNEKNGKDVYKRQAPIWRRRRNLRKPAWL